MSNVHVARHRYTRGLYSMVRCLQVVNYNRLRLIQPVCIVLICLHVDMRLKKKAQVTGETSTKGTDTQGQKEKQEDTTDDGITQVKDTSKTTLADLKKELKDQGLKTSGNKAELEERLKEASSSKSSTDTGGSPNVKKQKTDSGMSCVACVASFISHRVKGRRGNTEHNISIRTCMQGVYTVKILQNL